MPYISLDQIIEGAQCMASRVKDLDALGTALLEEAEGNNRLVESLREFRDDIESLNRIANQRTNAEQVSHMQRQNAHSVEILKENRELQICLDDYERAMAFMMQKYREHTGSKIFGEGILNFRETYNAQLWQIIREQREKINEMAAVMQHAAAADDDAAEREMMTISRLQLENQSLRELLEISEQNREFAKPFSVGRSAQTSELEDSSVASCSSTSLTDASMETGTGLSSPSVSSDGDNDSDFGFSSSDFLVKCLLNNLLGSVEDLAKSPARDEQGSSSVAQDRPAEAPRDAESDNAEAASSKTVRK